MRVLIACSSFVRGRNVKERLPSRNLGRYFNFYSRGGFLSGHKK